MIEQLAVVVYGVLTLILAMVLAYMQHSVLGMALAFAASGTTYCFQFLQLLQRETGHVGLAKALNALIVLSIILTIASAVASTFG